MHSSIYWQKQNCCGPIARCDLFKYLNLRKCIPHRGNDDAREMQAGECEAKSEDMNREVPNSDSDYIQGLLKISESKREERRVQRVRDYDRRNFKV